jgi:DNA-binding MarR family transcriptional regulator
MNQSKINLDSDLFTILSSPNFDKFTALELRSAYMSCLTTSEMDKNSAQRYVYRNILKLQKKGLLNRKDSKTTKKTTYVKTELFNSATFEVENASAIPIEDLPDTDESPNKANSPSKHLIQNLINQLHEFNAELLINLGEREQYKSLCQEYPQLKEPLQESYNLARNNFEKIKGHIKALNNAIEIEKQGQQI